MFWNRKKSIDYFDPKDVEQFSTSLNIPSRNFRALKEDLIKSVDELINEEINKDRNMEKTIYPISPPIISPSETGISEEKRMSEKIKELEDKLREEKQKSLEYNEKLKKEKNNKSKPMELIRVDIEIPPMVIRSKEMLSFHDYNSGVAVLPSHGVTIESHNAIENFAKINMPGYLEMKTKRKYHDNGRTCSMYFSKMSDEHETITIHANDEPFDFYWRNNSEREY